MRRRRRSLVVLGGLLLSMAVTSCGGGGGSGGAGVTTPPPVTTPLTITTDALPQGVVGAVYSFTLQASGGTGTRTWSISEGALPAGLTFSSGQFTGVPSQNGTFNFTVQVTDSAVPPQTATRAFSLQVLPPLGISDAPLPTAYLGESYSTAVQASGGVPPYTFSLAGGSGPLPAGLSLSSAGVISGTPGAEGAFSITVQVRDSGPSPQVSARSFLLQVAVRAPLEWTTGSDLHFVAGQTYSFPLVTGGLKPYTFSWFGDPTPCCYSINSEGVFSAQFVMSATFSLNISLFDSTTPPLELARTFTFHVAPGPTVIKTDALPNGRINRDYSAQIQALAGTPPYTFQVIAGELPPGLSLSPGGDFMDGHIAGQPTTEGTFTFTVEAADAGDPVTSDAKEFTIEVLPPLGRNDSILKATPIGPGTHSASISPYADPADLRNPDRDYYQMTANAGQTVMVETFSRRLDSRNPLDTVIEIVDANGHRLQTCRDPVYDNNPPSSLQPRPHPGSSYQDPCMNDDITLGAITDSRLEFRVPGAAGTSVTFYIHVFDWKGMARPDMTYNLVITVSD